MRDRVNRLNAVEKPEKLEYTKPIRKQTTIVKMTRAEFEALIAEGQNTNKINSPEPRSNKIFSLADIKNCR